MKTSNKWLLAALLLLLGSLSAFNAGLRAEYARGTYKDPLRNTTALNFKNFTEVDVQAASAMRVRVVAGPYGVRVGDEAAEYVRISQRGERLTVALVFPKEREYLGGGNVLTISCPQLKTLTAGATYAVANKPVTDADSRGGTVRVQGFRQDSLVLRQDHATRIELAATQLRHLRAEAGRSPGSRSVLHIERDNRIEAADLALRHRSELQLDSRIAVPRYSLVGDGVKVTLAGPAAAALGR